MNKPISIKKREFENSLKQLVLESGIPPIILEPILKDFHFNIKEMEEQQYQSDLKQYEQFLAEQSE